nr:MAG TPA: hypothetical protein [Caudoviricetes sp.]
MQCLGRCSAPAHSKEGRVRRGHVKNKFGKVAGLAVDVGILNLSANNSHKLILLVHGREGGRKCICTVRVFVEGGHSLPPYRRRIFSYAGRGLHLGGFSHLLCRRSSGFCHFVIEHGLSDKLQLVPLRQAVDSFVRNARVLHVLVDFSRIRLAVIAVPDKGSDFWLNGLIFSREALLIFLRAFGGYSLRCLPDTGAERLHSIRALLRFTRHSDVLRRVLLTQGLPVNAGVLSIDDCLYELVCLPEQVCRGVDLVVAVRALIKDGLPLLRYGLCMGFRHGMHGRAGIGGKFAPGISAEAFRHGDLSRFSLLIVCPFILIPGLFFSTFRMLFFTCGRLFPILRGLPVFSGGCIAAVILLQSGSNVIYAIQRGGFFGSGGRDILFFFRHS